MTVKNLGTQHKNKNDTLGVRLKCYTQHYDTQIETISVTLFINGIEMNSLQVQCSCLSYLQLLKGVSLYGTTSFSKATLSLKAVNLTVKKVGTQCNIVTLSIMILS